MSTHTGNGCYRTELRLVATAVSLVAAGASPRVTLAGLHGGSAIVAAARHLARSEGVDVVPIVRHAGCDLLVEAHG